ncbi:uncharacterized protein RCO7_11773 [Rhynchosporium graminicola]|uniref:Uncharacterized protein n=1 Tax=Rhynchosporium graminicola TaxID=2792576 RepID=A0A1E1LSZ6_9HELO|nr:uncharacterized protein RCO7_11773 [Rhynchosporium commune]
MRCHTYPRAILIFTLLNSTRELSVLDRLGFPTNKKKSESALVEKNVRNTIKNKIIKEEEDDLESNSNSNNDFENATKIPIPYPELLKLIINTTTAVTVMALI